MANREIEAILKISSKLGSMNALRTLSRELNKVQTQASAFNRAQTAAGKASNAVWAMASRAVAPAAIAYGAGVALKRFAEVERRVHRIGITAGASAEQTKAAFGVIDKAANDYAMTQDEITEGLDSLVASGRSMESAMAFLPAVAATAQAAGADIVSIATTADAIGNGFEIAGDRMQSAFDILVTAGKQGKFELKDMANYLPTLASSYAALGYKGEYAVKKLAASLQVVRQRTGSAEEAATAFSNVLQKMETEETAKRFGKFGIDLRKEMAKARKEGKDLVDVFVGLSEKAIKGDLSKLPQLFGDAQMITGMRALIQGSGELKRQFDALGSSTGAVKSDLDTILTGTEAKLDRLSASWDRFVKKVGGGVATIATPAMDAVSNTIDQETAYRQGLAKEEARGGNKSDALGEYSRRYQDIYGKDRRGTWSKAIQDAFYRDMVAFGRGEIASPYSMLDKIRAVGGQKRFPGQADAAAAAKTMFAGNLDGEALDRSPKLPSPRPMPTPTPRYDAAADLREQYAAYGEGRSRVRAAVLSSKNPMGLPDVGPIGLAGKQVSVDFETAAKRIEAGGAQAGMSIERAGDSLTALMPGAGDILANAIRAGASDAAAKLQAALSAATINIRAQGGPAPVSGSKGVSSPSTMPAARTPWGGPR